MTYVLSDLHGCYDKWKAMLEQLNLKEDDMLFVLGDIIDRGPEPMKLLFDMMERPNVYPIMGNHECFMLLCVRKLPLDTNLNNLSAKIDPGVLPTMRLWMKNGGRTTLEQYLALTPDQKEQILDYLQEFTLYEDLMVKDASAFKGMTRQEIAAMKERPVIREKQYILTHSGLQNFDPEKELDDYELEEFLSDRPTLDTRYYEDKMMVFGHTPTPLMREDQQPSILFAPTWINIDCGCTFDGGRLGCLRLEDWKEYYVD